MNIGKSFVPHSEKFIFGVDGMYFDVVEKNFLDKVP